MLLAVVVVASGCVAHGGATIGIRQSGKVSYGWQAGAGTVGELVVGQSRVDGRAFTYAGLHGWGPVVLEEGDSGGGLHETQLGMTLGVGGGGGHGAEPVVGIDVAEFIGARDHEDESVFTGAAAIIGVRVIDGEGEMYVGAELRHADYSILDGGD